MKYLFFRCNGGCYYRSSTHCPFDGWSMDGLDSVRAQFATLAEPDQTVAELAHRGVAPEILACVVIMEFGNERSAFDALAPGHYVKDGNVLKMGEVGLELM